MSYRVWGWGEAGEAWRSAFVRAPYLRESTLLLGVLAETFETAITWNHFDALVSDVTAATSEALQRVCGGGTVTCRLTHVSDGCAPYLAVLAPARRGSEVAQWDDIKAAASEALAGAKAAVDPAGVLNPGILLGT